MEDELVSLDGSPEGGVLKVDGSHLGGHCRYRWGVRRAFEEPAQLREAKGLVEMSDHIQAMRPGDLFRSFEDSRANAAHE